MLDKENRLMLGKELVEKSMLELGEKVYIYYDPEEKKLILKRYKWTINAKYFVATQLLEEKARMVIPAAIRNAFPEATYLPVEKDGEIYILIIEHEKKSE